MISKFKRFYWYNFFLVNNLENNILNNIKKTFYESKIRKTRQIFLVKSKI
jgi:hypothetical protein